MTQDTIILIMLAIVMLVGSYVSGSIPLVMRLGEDKLKFVTVLGAGLLVGTALTIIIPEGIYSLYLEPAEKKVHFEVQDHKLENGNHKHEDRSQTIGLSLLLGFVFMMLVDQVSQRRNPSGKNITATLGLVVHAAADGVALGAAATTSQQDVEMIVFLAIMLHKAPAAFGLVSFLLHEKIELQKIRRHLVIFSLSAPLFTLLTYFGIGQEQKETLNSLNATGIAMLFSGGTFLYVATVHVLPELTQLVVIENDLEVGVSNKQLQLVKKPCNSRGLSLYEITILICGAFLPLIITFGHHH